MYLSLDKSNINISNKIENKIKKKISNIYKKFCK